MTKNELAAKVAEAAGLQKLEALKAIEGVMQVMADTFAENENIYLRGFGTFKVVLRQAKVGRNIRRDTEVIVPAHHTVKFLPCSTLKEKVRKGCKTCVAGKQRS